jgi:hypothetical protein
MYGNLLDFSCEMLRTDKLSDCPSAPIHLDLPLPISSS